MTRQAHHVLVVRHDDEAVVSQRRCGAVICPVIVAAADVDIGDETIERLESIIGRQVEIGPVPGLGLASGGRSSGEGRPVGVVADLRGRLMFLVGAVALDAIDISVGQPAFIEEVALIWLHARIEPP